MHFQISFEESIQLHLCSNKVKKDNIISNVLELIYPKNMYCVSMIYQKKVNPGQFGGAFKPWMLMHQSLHENI
jgi:hypothetical protein